ncbi:MAG TPA: phosphotransferase [Herpetosiphonaceae bacterium]
MTTDSREELAATSRELERWFVLDGPVARLPGGEGRTYRAGDVIYRRDANAEENAFIVELYRSIEQRGFRVPLPLRSTSGAWTTAEGWTAWTFVSGQPATIADLEQVIPAIQSFHRVLARVARPAYLDRRDSPYDRADRLAWSDAPEVDDRFAALIAPLMQRKRALPDLGCQLIHGDLNEQNILVAPGQPPALIDMTPYWRPAPFALAVLAFWIGPYRGDAAVLRLFAQIPAFDQMLIRMALRTIFVSQEFARLGAEIGDVEREYGAAVEIICRWVDR